MGLYMDILLSNRAIQVFVKHLHDWSGTFSNFTLFSLAHLLCLCGLSLHIWRIIFVKKKMDE